MLSLKPSEKDDFSEAQLGSFGPAFVDGMEAFRKLVYAFYTKEFSFARFLSEYPEHQGGIVDISERGCVQERRNAYLPSDGKNVSAPT